MPKVAGGGGASRDDSETRQYFSPSSDGSCLTNAMSLSLIYLAIKALGDSEFSLELQRNAAFMRLASELDGREITEVVKACKIIIGSEPELVDKEKRLTRAIKRHVSIGKPSLYAELAETKVMLLEKGYEPFSDILLIDLCYLDPRNAAGYQALYGHILDVGELDDKPYAFFGLVRDDFVKLMTRYLIEGNVWLPASVLKQYIAFYGGDPETQSFCKQELRLSGGGDGLPDFDHLPDIHTFVSTPSSARSSTTKRMIEMGALRVQSRAEAELSFLIDSGIGSEASLDSGAAGFMNDCLPDSPPSLTERSGVSFGGGGASAG